MYTIGPSDIHGNGVILTQDVPAGASVGLAVAFEPGIKITKMGSMVNHSAHPTTHLVPVRGGWELHACRTLKAGAEVTADYNLGPNFIKRAELAWDRSYIISRRMRKTAAGAYNSLQQYNKTAGLTNTLINLAKLESFGKRLLQYKIDPKLLSDMLMAKTPSAPRAFNRELNSAYYSLIYGKKLPAAPAAPKPVVKAPVVTAKTVKTKRPKLPNVNQPNLPGF